MSKVTVMNGLSHAKGKSFAGELMSLPEMLDRTAAEMGEQTAITFYHLRLSYKQLQGLTRQVAHALHQIGVRKGDRVGIMLPNCPQYVAAFYGALRRGAIVVQVNPLYAEREIEHVLQDSGAEVLFVFADLYPKVRRMAAAGNLKKAILISLVPSKQELSGDSISWDDFLRLGSPVADETVDPEEDVAVLQYTGGTTGQAKGAMLTHRNLVVNAQQGIAHASEQPLTQGDKILLVIPLFHVYGMSCAMNIGILTGTNVILLPRFDVPEVLETIKEHQPTYFPGVPTMYVALNSHPDADRYGIDAIRVCNSGSAPLPVDLIGSFERKTGANMYEGYGLSEASPSTHANPRDGTKKLGSIGIPLPGTEARIVHLSDGTQTLPIGEAGELVIRGPQVMKGYWNMPQETASAIRDGWLYTGDIAKMDEDGFFYILDRKKDMIIASGYNVYPREVEEVLYSHPGVLEAVVVGVPDAYRGETVKAFLVLKPGQSATPEEIEGFCRQHLAAFKVPRMIEFRDSLPKTAVGKILRRVLVEEAKNKL
ncbi:long-chain fatty acid--CoA ligase [Brevibacillus humidisoli]|uniref:long-chain-fatty-acid--CoA ligase n=1 Tax=Brevibacillus humidisoli TaxID=2895522 RepID=UPI001E31AAB0|nr:long-chain fatty acid--CoA ligase [Brevibacillus humidisoli]UFJ43020.1 long-chain fatty acid--CoA ligase [Brevibacillus humidisoli]